MFIVYKNNQHSFSNFITNTMKHDYDEIPKTKLFNAYFFGILFGMHFNVNFVNYIPFCTFSKCLDIQSGR